MTSLGYLDKEKDKNQNNMAKQTQPLYQNQYQDSNNIGSRKESINNDSYNILVKNQSDFAKNTYEPIRNRASSKSIYDDRGSEDNKSYKSGVTGRASYAGGFDNF